MRNRLPLDPHGDHADIDEDISMSSWAYGDPAPPILKAYVGDPAKIRLIHGGVKETHVFHLHNHQWRRELDDSRSTIIDSVSIGPQECFTLDILYGAGSLNGMIGDAIFHCHLYPHFHEGMWTLWRVFDRLQRGGDAYPDGTPIEPLQPLRDRPLPPEKDEWHPGYPNFINGIFPQEPSQPPLGILTAQGENKIEPTPLEEANFVPDYAPGALYTSTCPCHAACDVKVFEIAAVQANIVYNRFGWHDPQGRFLVLKEEIEKYGTLENYLSKVECGEIRPEPLVIRANAGDCIEVRFTNLLPEYIEESPFQMRTLTDIVGYHIHLVKFDTIVSDGSANGWNNIAGARKYETLIERFFANEELHTVFFHDHLFANMHQQHGMFGALIVEPAGAEFLDPHSLCPIHHGTQAVIRRKDGTAFREFALFIHDFALLFDRNGKPLNPPEQPGTHDDPGVMGINYRCEPMPERLKCKEDPAHIFSSLTYWDPATPILETYPGEELVIRLLDGAHEEQHAFNIVGMSWKKEITNPDSPVVAAQTIGISEAFNIRIEEPYAAGDYLYYSGGVDDGAHGEVDHEDTGEKGINYRSERFYNRFQRIPLAYKLFDSKVHGEPATPVLKAYTKERVIIRYLMPGDKPRNTAFLIHGHAWREQPENPLSNVEPVKGAISVGNVYNLELLGGASDCPGDYLYRSGALRWDVESGMWGILRIQTRTAFCTLASCCRNVGQWWEKVWKNT